MTALIDYFLALGQANPILVAILLGTISGWSTATVMEFLIAGFYADVNFLKRIVIIVNIAGSGLTTFLLWTAFSPNTPPRLIASVCYALAWISPLSYIWAAKLASRYVPWINSLWSLDDPFNRRDPR